MGELKFTPGPWEIETSTMAGNHRIIIGSYGFGSVAAISRNGAPRSQSKLSVDSPYYQEQINTMIGNAKLIAAAPKMFAALKKIATQTESGPYLTTPQMRDIAQEALRETEDQK